MQITKVIRKKDDGTFEATLVLTDDQTRFLINFAIGVLVQQGLANIVEQEDGETQEQQEQVLTMPAPESLN